MAESVLKPGSVGFPNLFFPTASILPPSGEIAGDCIEQNAGVFIEVYIFDLSFRHDFMQPSSSLVQL